MSRFTNSSLPQNPSDVARPAYFRLVSSGMNAYLIQELRDSHPYLRDQGWHQVAKLMLAGADEIERLHCRVRELESKIVVKPGQTHHTRP